MKAGGDDSKEKCIPNEHITTKKKSWFPKTSTIAIILFVVYILAACRQFYYVMNPMLLLDVDVAGPQISPLWKEETMFEVKGYLSLSKKFKKSNFTGTSSILLLDEKGIQYTRNAVTVSRKLNLTGSKEDPVADLGKEGHITHVIDQSIWNKLQGNSSIYLHVFITQEGYSPDPASQNYNQLKTLHGMVPLVKYGPHPKSRPTRYLLNDLWMYLGLENFIKEIPQPKKKVKPVSKGTPVALWKPEIAIKLVNDFSLYPLNQLPAAIADGLSVVQTQQDVYQYLPPMHVDEIGLTSDRYTVLNATVEYLPLEISIAPMSVQRWLLMQNLESALRQQVESFGFSESDVDDIRNLISNTNIYLLGVTLLASTLHLLFEFLAFKSDVNFWKSNKSLKGLSTRSVIIQLISQIVIFLYLMDVDTSLLVTIPSFIGILIQSWKVKRATGITLRIIKGIPTVVCTRLEEEQKKQDTETKEVVDTVQYDKYAINFMAKLLLPVAIAYSVKSLVYDMHPGWYSWAVASLTGCVYTFGFVLMTPQLYINYKLKSVAHLPWRFLAYRFVNTFIDDLFAFIIKMPTMHRISCFRDDIVFIIYLYQRKIYPVDTSRAIAEEDAAN